MTANPVINPADIINRGISFICWEMDGSIIVVGRIHIMIAPNVIDIVLMIIIGVLIFLHSFIITLGLKDRGPHTVAIDIRIE